MNADNNKMMMEEIKAKIKDMKFRAMEFMPFSKPSDRLWNAHTELMMEFTRLTDLAVSPAVNDDDASSRYFESKKIAIRSRILLKLDNILTDVFDKKDDDYDIGSVCEQMRTAVLGEACVVMGTDKA
jgi:hypothetical protein